MGYEKNRKQAEKRLRNEEQYQKEAERRSARRAEFEERNENVLERLGCLGIDPAELLAMLTELDSL
jgi:hypothetical protein